MVLIFEPSQNVLLVLRVRPPRRLLSIVFHELDLFFLLLLVMVLVVAVVVLIVGKVGGMELLGDILVVVVSPVYDVFVVPGYDKRLCSVKPLTEYMRVSLTDMFAGGRRGERASSWSEAKGKSARPSRRL